jgi:hypothetical protein
MLFGVAGLLAPSSAQGHDDRLVISIQRPGLSIRVGHPRTDATVRILPARALRLLQSRHPSQQRIRKAERALANGHPRKAHRLLHQALYGDHYRRSRHNRDHRSRSGLLRNWRGIRISSPFSLPCD